MFKVGDTVYVEASAVDDCTLQAWKFIHSHPRGVIKQLIRGRLNHQDTREAEQAAIEFAEIFPGGHDCAGMCAPRRGQFVMTEHLSLCFEESRDAQTIPQINTGDRPVGNVTANPDIIKDILATSAVAGENGQT